MISFVNTLSILEPVEKVFTFYTSLENLPKWNYYVEQVTKTTKHIHGQGAAYHVKRKKDEHWLTIMETRANKLFIVQTAPDARIYLERHTRFEAVGEATVIEDEMIINTPIPNLIERLLQKGTKKSVLENLRKLKQLLETGSTQLQDGQQVYL